MMMSHVCISLYVYICSVVRIHNSVNERAWSEVLRWERAHCTATCPLKELRLIKFKGRPRDFSFKARVKNALGYKLPFDRHDWTVRSSCSTSLSLSLSLSLALSSFLYIDR